jgi:RNA polymerase sigma-70 factor (ECF subfamily)
VIADDLLQKTLLQIHRKRATYASGFAVLPWAYAIARRLCIDEFRSRRTDLLWSARELLDDHRLTGGLPDDDVASRQLVAQVEAELARMPETQRVAFELLRIEGLSHDEAAQVLGTTVSAVKLRAFRANTALRAVLGGSVERAGAGKTSRAV